MSTILLVEDDDSIRALVCELLAEEGYDVVAAIDGRDALIQLGCCPELPQLILLDLLMPDINGQQFLQIHQRDPHLAAVPVILFSAASQLEQIAPTAAVDYVAKPFELTTLLTTIAHYCDVSYQPHASAYCNS